MKLSKLALKDLKKSIAVEVELSRISCGIRKECNTECGKCGAERIVELLVLKGVLEK